jgi:peroxiredoxin
VSQRANKWLLGILVGSGLLIGAQLLAKHPYEPPEVKAMRERAAFLKTWKSPLILLSKAPEFSLKDSRGRAHSLAEFRGKPLLLDFYSDDPRSRTWAREMSKLWNHLGKSTMRSVAVVNFSPEAAQAFIRDTKDESLYLFEDPANHPVRDQYHAAPGPNAWVLDSRGIIRHASAPMTTDKNAGWDQDFHEVYLALSPLIHPLPAHLLPRMNGGPQPPHG